MKPSEQKIINKLPKEKVDLATQKVDLSEAKAKALAKDFRKAESGLKTKIKILQKLENELKNIEKIKISANKEIDETVDFMEIYGRGKDRYNILIDSFEKKARELGIKVDQIPVIKELDKAFDDAADAYRPVQQKVSTLGDLSGRFSP